MSILVFAALLGIGCMLSSALNLAGFWRSEQLAHRRTRLSGSRVVSIDAHRAVAVAGKGAPKVA